MNYPLISEYIEAIKAAEDNFATLSNLRPVLDNNGEPIMSSGNFAVVFKMKDEKTRKIYAVKCFLKEQEGRAEAYHLITEELNHVKSSYIIHVEYLDKELFVYTNSSVETEFPVLLMDWVDGITLDKYIRNHIDDSLKLYFAACQFFYLVVWLKLQPFAHGDLKPDNILIRKDGTMVLVDYDGMYVPAMRGQKSRELGSPNFRHPSRSIDDFNEHIDNLSIASILVSLTAISLQPSLLEEYGASDRLLFSEKDYLNLAESKVMYALVHLMYSAELNTVLSLFILAVSRNELSNASLFILPHEPMDIFEVLSRQYYEKCSIKITDVSSYRVDRYGAIYSDNYEILYSSPEEAFWYNVNERTKVIANGAFCHLNSRIFLPSSVQYITSQAFGEDTTNLEEIGVESNPNYYKMLLGRYSEKIKKRDCGYVPNSRTESEFEYTGAEYSRNGEKLISLKKVSPNISCYQVRQGVKLICGSVANNIREIIIPDGVEKIGFCGLSQSSLLTINFPSTLREFETGAFTDSKELKVINIPEGVEKIWCSVFQFCPKLETITLPSSLRFIRQYSFRENESLKTIIFKGCPEIDTDCFDNCTSIQTILIPVGTRVQFEKMLPMYKDKLKEQ